jgi:hypothetical protein
MSAMREIIGYLGGWEEDIMMEGPDAAAMGFPAPKTPEEMDVFIENIKKLRMDSYLPSHAKIIHVMEPGTCEDALRIFFYVFNYISFYRSMPISFSWPDPDTKFTKMYLETGTFDEMVAVLNEKLVVQECDHGHIKLMPRNPQAGFNFNFERIQTCSFFRKQGCEFTNKDVMVEDLFMNYKLKFLFSHDFNWAYFEPFSRKKSARK